MNSTITWYKRYLGWLWKYKVLTVIIVIIAIIVAANLGDGNKKNPEGIQVSTDTSSTSQQTDGNTSQPATPAPNSSSNSSTPAQTAPAKSTLRQDLAFQGDATYCDGIYKDNGNGTTTWSYDIKQDGELITHLSDNSGHTYRHDIQITNAPNYYAYTAPVAINDVAEIDGVLTASSDGNGHPCNLSPQQQPQQAY